MASLATSSEYWEHLFDVETGYPKEEIQNEFEVLDLDLLIIDYVAIYPEYGDSGSPSLPFTVRSTFLVRGADW